MRASRPRKNMRCVVPKLIVFVLALTIPVTYCVGADPVPPPQIAGVGVDEHLGAMVPLDLTFENDKGEVVRLGDYFKDGKPVILQLAYYNCPMLCTLVSKGIVDSLKNLTLQMGKDFQVVEVSIDPEETVDLAAAKKRSSMDEFSKGNETRLDPKAWHFLVGKQNNIQRLADVVGFRYVKIGEGPTRQFAHPAVIMICSPDGKITRYLYGTTFGSSTLRLSLVEASEGKVGTTLDRFILTCFHFDPNSGKYVWAAVRFMQIGGVLTVLILALTIWRLSRHTRRTAPKQSPGDAA